jgi:hypothetical protein
MNNASTEFNTQLALDVLVNGLTEVTKDYVNRFEYLDFTEVIIPEGVKTIGNYAFVNCYKLTSLTIPATVKSIGNAAFYGCSGLKNLRLPEIVPSLGRFAFSSCHYLKSISPEK